MGGGTAAVVVIVDRLTKLWALNALADGEIVPIEGILGFDLAFNTGAAYGLFKGGGSVIAVGALVAAGLIIYALRSVERRFEAVTLGAIMGGALGNFVDRMTRGYVIDFIEWHILSRPRLDWPTFNVADVGISVGAAVLLAYIAKDALSREPS